MESLLQPLVALQDHKKAEKFANSNVRAATRVITKITGIVLSLESNLADPVIGQVPPFAVDPAKVSLKAVQKAKQSCEELIARRGHGDFDVLPTDVDKLYKDAVERNALVGRLLTTARQHGVR